MPFPVPSLGPLTRLPVHPYQYADAALSAFLPIRLWLVLLAVFCAGCGSVATKPAATPASLTPLTPQRADVVIAALGLVDTGYRFGGVNPEAGLDCSGLVVLVWERVVGKKLPRSAAEQARTGRSRTLEELVPGDLVFFNTLRRPFSHVGIYVGEGRFVHATSSRGKVRVDRLADRYYSARFEAARSLLD